MHVQGVADSDMSKGSKKKADTNTTTKQKPPTVPRKRKKRSGEKESRRLKRVREDQGNKADKDTNANLEGRDEILMAIRSQSKDLPIDGADDDQEPFAGTDRGSKRRRSGKEPESTNAPRETTTTTAGKTTTGSKTHKQSASQSAPVEDTMQTTDCLWARLATPGFETVLSIDEQAGIRCNLAMMTMTLGGPTFELMKGTCKSLTELEYFCEEVYKATTEKIGTGSTPNKPPNILMICDSHYRWESHIVANARRQFNAFETTKGIKSLASTQNENYAVIKFKEGDFHRLRIQDIEDMLLLLVQGKVKISKLEERVLRQDPCEFCQNIRVILRYSQHEDGNPALEPHSNKAHGRSSRGNLRKLKKVVKIPVFQLSH
ncbi:hypothetical protein Tco_0449328 [Tanacetum coccineum]